MTRFTFGPVPSRRLGFSLGVDAIPRKYCSFDCIYCQVGKTTHCEVNREIFFDPNAIVEEIISESKRLENIDFVTFSGSGEPTLNADMGRMIDEVKRKLKIPVCVITNASLLHNASVRSDLSKADIVLPSLDAASEHVFRQINRPHPSIDLHIMIEGMKRFRNEYKGKIWLEIMLLEGINDSQGDLEKLKNVVEHLGVDRVQLNTVTRPPADETARGLSSVKLKKICAFFGEGCEIICKFRKTAEKSQTVDWHEAILDILGRRFLTLDDIVRITGVRPHKAKDRLRALEAEGKIKSFHFDDALFYMKTENKA